MRIHVAIPFFGRSALVTTAVRSLERMQGDESYTVYRIDNRPGECGTPPEIHARKLDALLEMLPAHAQWLFVMQSDAAALRPGWLAWLLERMGDAPIATLTPSRTVGALYRVDALRDQRASFRADPNPGDAIMGHEVVIPCAPDLPWWLRGCEACRDEDGRLLYAHLGGGTIGHTWHHEGRLYPRMPWWCWPAAIRSVHATVLRKRTHADAARVRCLRCRRMFYFYAPGPPVCFTCLTPTEQTASLEAMGRARQTQEVEERDQ